MRSKGGCPACVSLPRKQEGWGRGTIERKRVTSLRGWRDLSMDGEGGWRIANPRGSERRRVG